MKSKLQLIVLSITLVIAAFTTVSNAQTKQFKDGNVWELSFIKTKPNMDIDYLNSLKANWKAVADEAVKQGLILSYKVFAGTASNPQDWDIMLMMEYKNFASMEGNDAKWEAIMKSTMGSEDAARTTNEKRVNVREIFGNKIMREVIY